MMAKSVSLLFLSITKNGFSMIFMFFCSHVCGLSLQKYVKRNNKRLRKPASKNASWCWNIIFEALARLEKFAPGCLLACFCQQLLGTALLDFLWSSSSPFLGRHEGGWRRKYEKMAQDLKAILMLPRDLSGSSSEMESNLGFRTFYWRVNNRQFAYKKKRRGQHFEAARPSSTDGF